MSVALVAHKRSPTNIALSYARPGVKILSPAAALRTLVEGDIAISRLDVAQELDSIEAGLWELARLEACGVRVLNRPPTLVGAHDKLATARLLTDAVVAHPRTIHVSSPRERVPFSGPVVVKPRFGSWGREIALCRDAAELRAHLRAVAGRRWFEAHGAIVQELVPPQGYDVRLIVAGQSIVGAVSRVAAPGEWRTNVALGATRHPTQPSEEACCLALAAARAIEGDLVGVDLLPLPGGGYTVIELNAAVDFTPDYALTSDDVFARTLDALLPDPVAAAA